MEKSFIVWKVFDCNKKLLKTFLKKKEALNFAEGKDYLIEQSVETMKHIYIHEPRKRKPRKELKGIIPARPDNYNQKNLYKKVENN